MYTRKRVPKVRYVMMCRTFGTHYSKLTTHYSLLTTHHVHE